MNPLYPDNNKDNNHIVKYHPGKQCKFTFDINKVIIKPSDEEFKQGIEVTSSKNYLHQDWGPTLDVWFMHVKVSCYHDVAIDHGNEYKVTVELRITEQLIDKIIFRFLC